MTIQEMFDKAVRGLAGQGWRRSADECGECVYHSPNGDRCAWGHVDPRGTEGRTGHVTTLAGKGVGLAAQLSIKELYFAEALQHAHDFGPVSKMPLHFKRLGEYYGLTWPSDVPKETVQR